MVTAKMHDIKVCGNTVCPDSDSYDLQATYAKISSLRQGLREYLESDL